MHHHNPVRDLKARVVTLLILIVVFGLAHYAAGPIGQRRGAFQSPFDQFCIALLALLMLIFGGLISGALIFGLYVFSFFVVEIVEEAIYLCRLRLQRARLCDETSESTALLAAAELPTREPRKHRQPSCEYEAININAINPGDLAGGAYVKALPRQLIRLPVIDVAKIAVLSWRWDFVQDTFKDSSKNLAAALKYAQSAGIQFLFADIIAIDQKLGAEELVDHIKEFSRLYQAIPVILAYDQEGAHLHEIMFRPWIFSETRLISQNRAKAVYVGHNKQGACITEPFPIVSIFERVLGRLPRCRSGDTNFAKQLSISWRSDFVTSVLQVLNGTVAMANLYDFKFIIPVFAEVFKAAETLDRNDYLLTVALLASACRYGDNPEHRVDDEFTKLNYKKYAIRSRVEHEEFKHYGAENSEPACWTIHNEIHSIYLQDRKIANFVSMEQNWSTGCIPKYQIFAGKTMESNILKVVGLDEAALARYHAQEKERRVFLRMPAVADEGPRLEVVSVRL